MASAKSLRKYAKTNLTPLMQERGFEIVKGLSYIKPAPEDMVYFIDCLASRWGNVTFDVGVFVPELDAGQREDLLWPKAMRSLVGGALTDDQPMLKYIQHAWNFEKDPEDEISRVQEAVEKYALPFFDSIVTRGAMLEAIDDDWYKWERDEELLKRIAKGGPSKIG